MVVMTMPDDKAKVIDIDAVDVPAIGKAKTNRPIRTRKLRVSKPRLDMAKKCDKCPTKCKHNCETCVYARYYELQKKRYIAIITGRIKEIPVLFRDTIKDWIFSTVQINRWSIPIWVWFGFLILGPLWLVPFFIYIVLRGDAEQ